MFTPQRKDVAFTDGPPPPLGSLNDRFHKIAAAADTGNMDDWRKFKKAGLLDAAAMERKDREALLEKASRLQSELFDYQHNLGLILLEKKMWASKYDQLGQDLAETEEIFKREQSAHLIALSEVETRRDNLKKALAAEKQHVSSLKKALCEVKEERAEIKLTSQKKLADANALMHGIEEKSLKLQKKLNAAEAKLAEVNRKSSELEMRMHEVEARESVLQTEQISLATRKEAHQVTSHKEEDGLRKWQQKLQEREESLSRSRELLNDKEQKVNENGTIMKQKEKDLEEIKKKIDQSSSILKEKEDDVNRQLADVEAKEKEADLSRSLLEKKQEELDHMEENLRGRERMETQQLLHEQSALLQKKREEFELQLEEKRHSVENEGSITLGAIKRKDIEINHKKEKLVKQEQALDKKLHRTKEKEGDLERKLKALKAKDKILKADERKHEVERLQMLADRDSLQSLIDEIEKIRTASTQKEWQFHEEREKLQVIKEERSEHVRLQCQLMQEIESYRLQNKIVTKEHDDLKQERVKFERDWEALDEKRTEIHNGLGDLEELRKKLEILRTEEERLRNEKTEMLIYMQRELDNVKQEKELFASTTRHEQQALSQQAQNKHNQLLQDIELQRKDLESHLQKSQEELEKRRQERELAFEEERKRERNEILYLKDIALKEKEELSSERHQLEKEKEVVTMNRKELIADHLEIHQDIDKLNVLSKELKCQREQLIQDRICFLAFVDKLKSCENCGVSIKEFMVPDLQMPADIREPDLLANLDVESLKLFQKELAASEFDSDSGGRMSWLRRCSRKILNLSPIKRIGQVVPPVSMKLAADCTDLEAKEPSVSAGDVKRFSFSDNIRVAEDRHAHTFDDFGNVDSKFEEASEGSKQPDLKREKQKREKGLNSRHRTHSMKATVQDAKLFLGETVGQSDLNVLVQKSDSKFSNKETTNVRKRPRAESSTISVSEQDGDDSERCSDSITTGRQRKRQQKIASVQAQGESRYNLRRPKIGGTASATEVSGNLTTGMEKEKDATMTAKVEPSGEAFVTSSLRSVDGENIKKADYVQLTTVRTIYRSEDRVVQFESLRNPEDNASMEKLVGMDDLCDEVNDTSEYEDEDGNMIDDAEDEYDEEQPDAKSIGKKIWTFFTT
ncbi:protein CROWDED NUCLEI 1-like isoform X1 [Cucurbita moschata]|uniref:Protein CROWDED NUCLEI 1-like isoform X1 n=1 Tax=Cucurbita moschata TaxID=3662 RepID=A0A6J1EPS4_CUCMO|nr:protein CROWDED NUCLEI 1-like isoform X1 [Cucurbita moschata]XP_022930032.1 protein CROWDED NUCLEI 1-like isoform X1 [Cucurbita moschata]